MKHFFTVLFALFIVFACVCNATAAKKTGTGNKSLDETVQVTGKIVHIEARACKISISEQDGQVQRFHVAPVICTSLNQFKVGDKITATENVDAATLTSLNRQR